MTDFEIEVSTNCVSEEVDRRAIILNIETGMYHELNKTGTLIWNEINAGRISKSDLIARLNEKFFRNDLEEDIHEFLEQMLKKQIIFRKDI